MSNHTPQVDSIRGQNGNARKNRVLTVIAGVSGDGSTLVADNLAAIAAANGRRAYCIDMHSGAELDQRLGCGRSAADAISTVSNIQLYDCPAGYHSVSTALQLNCDTIVLCTTTRPESVIGTYAIIKTIAATGCLGELILVINRAGAAEGAEVARRIASVCNHFLGLSVTLGGVLPDDRRSSRHGTGASPIVKTAPRAPLSLALRHLAATIDLAQPLRQPINDPWLRVAALFL
jgi:MinD-like ATPase involved in chromosome partitioning or flagellar assembly